MKPFAVPFFLVFFTVALIAAPDATAAFVVFGSGANQFEIEFVPIGNPNNAADTTGVPNPVGSVSYGYDIGKYEVSRDMINKANSSLASGGGDLGITLADMTSLGGNGANRPATGVSWNEAARFVNWLNTSQGFSPAYKFTTQPGDAGYSANQNISLWVPGDAGFNAANQYRNSLARYVLPSVDEWYKAAYYNPSSGTYVDFPTGSNSLPMAVASGTSPGTAVFGQPFSQGPADVTQAGGLSFYGTMGQGGNVWEMEETDFDLVNDLSLPAGRGTRGGSWNASVSAVPNTLSALFRSGNGNVPTSSTSSIGFRVASVSVPEPSPVLYGGVLMLGLACWKLVPQIARWAVCATFR
ncbi:MAG: SUMF1/EgtB/PvdO family nonheme iron enzyme [Planctomycetales bacterium]|nr:SUMF1/EgtB/PvdO family nonheme iron enzyme [Planctomycetales bacterium]